MRIIVLLSLLTLGLLPVSGAAAQTKPRSAAAAAKAFTLDLAGPDTVTAPPPPTEVAPTQPASAEPLPAEPAPAEPAPVEAKSLAAEPVATPASFTLDTPIAQLIADPRAKAVLDRDMPGLSDDSNLAKFRLLSLRQFQPMTGGQMSAALLEKTGMDLAAIGGGAPVAMPEPLPSVPAATASNKHRDSGR